MMFIGNNTKPRYDNDCFARRIRYHTSPICERIEREEHQIIPVTNWKWTLRSAMERKCQMPDVSNIIQAGGYFILSIYPSILYIQLHFLDYAI